MIKKDKFYLFKVSRIIVPISLLGTFLSAMLMMQYNLGEYIIYFFGSLSAISILICALWMCPNCNKLFCTAFNITNRFKIAGIFPFINECIHCGFDINESKTKEANRH